MPTEEDCVRTWKHQQRAPTAFRLLLLAPPAASALALEELAVAVPEQTTPKTHMHACERTTNTRARGTTVIDTLVCGVAHGHRMDATGRQTNGQTSASMRMP